LYQFNNAGTYYYWSGLVDSQEITFRGVIQVQAINKFITEPSVKVNKIEGIIFIKDFLRKNITFKLKHFEFKLKNVDFHSSTME